MSLAEPGKVPGVSIVYDGKTLGIDDGARHWPTAAVGFPDHPITDARVETDGPDLVVRLEGPALSEVTDHPAAPKDPVLTWVRIRPRPTAGWRVVVDGMATLSLPAGPVQPTSDETITLRTEHWGQFELVPGGRATRSEMNARRWSWSTTPSLERIDPYPRTRLTWHPPEPEAATP